MEQKEWDQPGSQGKTLSPATSLPPPLRTSSFPKSLPAIPAPPGRCGLPIPVPGALQAALCRSGAGRAVSTDQSPRTKSALTFLPSAAPWPAVFPRAEQRWLSGLGEPKGGHRGDEALPDLAGWMEQRWSRSCSLLQVQWGDADVPKMRVVTSKARLKSVICLNLFILEAAPQPGLSLSSRYLRFPASSWDRAKCVMSPPFPCLGPWGQGQPLLPHRGPGGTRHILRAPVPGALLGARGGRRGERRRGWTQVCAPCPTPLEGSLCQGGGFPWALQKPRSRWDHGIME